MERSEICNTPQAIPPTVTSEGGCAEATDFVDLTMLDSYAELQVEGEPDLVVELIDLYIEDAHVKMRGLREMLAEADCGALKRLAHSLKGSSGNVGARRVAALCEEFERIDCDDSFEKTGELLTRLGFECERVSAVFAAERQRRM
jgi:HPt (histidine-containing phosphotransfer) domain-containing protein